MRRHGEKLNRATLVERLRAEIRGGRPIYDALCGSGITAKMAARGGADMVTTHCLAYFRMQGISSVAGYLPICDANALTLELGERALVNVVRECALVAGLLCVDPTRDMACFLERIKAAGYDGVMNCPTVALIDGKFRSDLEETGMGFTREVEVLGLCVAHGFVHKGVLVRRRRKLSPWRKLVWTILSCISATARGAQSVRKQWLRKMSHRESEPAWCSMALSTKFPDRIVTCHGGAIETPADFERFSETLSRA